MPPTHRPKLGFESSSRLCFFLNILQSESVRFVFKPENKVMLTDYLHDIPYRSTLRARWEIHLEPISILPDISKVFKRVLYKKFCSYMSKNKILHDDQCGFRKNRSTTDALLNQTPYLFDSIDSGNLAFFYFSIS